MVQTFHTNIVNVVCKYLNLLKVPATETSVKEYIEQDPYFPSLLTITNVLDKLNVPNKAFNISENELEQLEVPFITYYSTPKIF